VLLPHGVSVKVVSGMLGHLTISITLDLFGHARPDMQAGAAEVISRLLARKAGR
jgi:hypothetical protein